MQILINVQFEPAAGLSPCEQALGGLIYVAHTKEMLQTGVSYDVCPPEPFQHIEHYRYVCIQPQL